jgi:hypothetical protein
MAGLVPAATDIDVDGRAEPGRDEGGASGRSCGTPLSA